MHFIHNTYNFKKKLFYLKIVFKKINNNSYFEIIFMLFHIITLNTFNTNFLNNLKEFNEHPWVI
jgi:hypothetical protein